MSKTILITGGAGFIAHHVIDKILANTDWKIITILINGRNQLLSSY